MNKQEQARIAQMVVDSHKNPNRLKFADLKYVIGCFILGGVISTGLLCMYLGIFHNEKLQEISTKVDKVHFIEPRHRR